MATTSSFRGSRADLGDELRLHRVRTTLGSYAPGIGRLAGEAHGSRWHRCLRTPRPCGGRSERDRLTVPSFTEWAIARSASSRSMVSWVTCLPRRASSSRSALVRPSGSPRSIRSWRTQLPKVSLVRAEFTGNLGDGAVLIQHVCGRVLRGTGSGSGLVGVERDRRPGWHWCLGRLFLL